MNHGTVVHCTMFVGRNFFQKIIMISFIAFGVLITAIDAAQYAVLAAGSSGWYNYRHHADVCHAYHILIKRGIPADNIITMYYDDVANSKQNPFPGKIFNQPMKSNAVDVYAGCGKDYVGEDVSPETFLAVISGNSSGVLGKGTERVLQSTANDEVFINFVDHGAPGLVAFPHDSLYADELIETLMLMHKRKMYKNLVFYLEACESGSMFQNLSQGYNIFAETASNSHESSWATFCPPSDDSVNGVVLGTCLGDSYSVNWMMDTEAERTSETLAEQFSRVKQLTNKSHVKEFGDLKRMSTDAIDKYLGNETHEGAYELIDPSTRMVDSRDVTLDSKFFAYQREQSLENLVSLQEEIAHRKETDVFFKEFVVAVLGKEVDLEEIRRPNPSKFNFKCHRSLSSVYKNECRYQWTDYSLKYAGVFFTLCEESNQNGLLSLELIASFMRSTCIKSFAIQ